MSFFGFGRAAAPSAPAKEPPKPEEEQSPFSFASMTGDRDGRSRESSTASRQSTGSSLHELFGGALQAPVVPEVRSPYTPTPMPMPR